MLTQISQQGAQLLGFTPTDKQFWDAAYVFDGSPPNATNDNTELYRLLSVRGPKNIPLGKVYGTQALGLEPNPYSALPACDLPPNFSTKFKMARTMVQGIAYPDGHPSIEYVGKELGSDERTEKDKLHRCVALGMVHEDDGQGHSLGNTGFVLVMDMEKGRDRHPWLVLASEWPADEELPDGDLTFYAPATVARDDEYQEGVFPGDTNRTPICKIMPLGLERNGPVLKQFGRGFCFKPLRLGGHRRTRLSQCGPDLAHVMQWHRGLESEEDVCYYRDGGEYMRYKPASEEFRFPALDRTDFAGEQGFEGELEGKATISENVAGRYSAVPQHDRFWSDAQGFWASSGGE